MQTEKNRILKKKFRIGELAKELQLKKFVIRFWEKEFGLASDRSHGGQRFYSEEDFSTFSLIKDLLYEQGFTIAGARLQLKMISQEHPTIELQKIEGNVCPATTTMDDFSPQSHNQAYQAENPAPEACNHNPIIDFVKLIKNKLAELKSQLIN